MKYIFLLMFFKKEEYATYEIIAYVKRKHTGQWYFNNLLFPLLTLLSPMIFFLLSFDSETFKYNKSILDLLVSGSLTLMGLSVLRSAHTNVKDEVDESKLSGQGLIIRNQVVGKINVLRGKLVRWSWTLTFLGWLFYVAQVGQIISTRSRYILWYVLSFIMISLLSICIGRFMYLMDTNYLENSAATNTLSEIFKDDKSEEDALRDKLKNQGL